MWKFSRGLTREIHKNNHVGLYSKSFMSFHNLALWYTHVTQLCISQIDWHWIYSFDLKENIFMGGGGKK